MLDLLLLTLDLIFEFLNIDQILTIFIFENFNFSNISHMPLVKVILISEKAIKLIDLLTNR